MAQIGHTLIGICLLLAAAGCNPFHDKRGAESQACYTDGTCDQGLECFQAVCYKACDSFLPDCSARDTGDQGFDLDGDGWGRCCDCDDTNATVWPGADESCNGIDDDCDQQTDEGFDIDGDGFTSCDGDCDDTDPLKAPDLLERCDGEDNDCDGSTDEDVDVAESCDGQDNDCDGLTDEDVPPRPCPLTEGICAPARSNCQGDGTWTGCDYGPDYTEGVDADCDGEDNDCDGETDEDAIDPLAPEIGELATDGLDNNCNGLVDEPGGVLVPVVGMDGVWIDAYEIVVQDSPDCMGTAFGQVGDDYPAGWPAGEDSVTETLYACSLAGVLPSSHLSFHRAKRACEAQGKRLCTSTEWSTGCYGGLWENYPYGPRFVPGACNDPYQGEQVAPTGAFVDCVNEVGAYDMSGNLAEWVTGAVEQSCPDIPLAVGFHFRCEFCTCGELCATCDGNPTEVEHLSGCYVWKDPQEAYPPETTLPRLGARCCYQP